MMILTSGRFWIGLILGAALYHFWMMKQAKSSGAA